MSDSIADDILRNGYDRWLRLEEEKAAIGDDLKELFAELKEQGFTPKALRESFRRVRNADSADQQEHDAIVDLYVASLTRARPAHTREAGQSYSEAKGRGDAGSSSSRTADFGSANAGSNPAPVTNSQTSGRNGPAAAGSTTDGAETSSAPATHSHSSEIPLRSNTAGEAPSSNLPASPATIPHLRPSSQAAGSPAQDAATREAGASAAASRLSFNSDTAEVSE